MKRILTLIALATALPLSAPIMAKPAKGKDSAIGLPLQQIIPPHQRLCTQTTASGLGYKVLRAGTGAAPVDSDTPVINYIGYLAANGVVFDQNVNVDMPVGGVIAGFAEGLKLTPQGGITRICIPAKLGYGERATGPIPANSDLIFQIEMIKVPNRG